MTTYGVTATGFVLKPLSVIQAEIEADQRSLLGANVNQEADFVLGVVNGIVSAKLSELWELAQACYSVIDPDTAEGAQLDNVLALTGMTRLPATKSAVVVTCTGTPGTVLPAGRVLTVGVAGTRFVSTTSATIGGGGTVDVIYEAENTGPVIANATTLNTIVTPVSGWASASNALDAIVGTDVETDEAARLRRQSLIASPGSSTQPAIRAKLLALSGVLEAFVFENDSDTVDASGVPAHSIECVVFGGTDADIANSLYEVGKACGIQAYGTTTVVVGGVTIGFSRPVDEVLSVNVVLTKDARLYPADGNAQVKAALAAFADATYKIGSTVIRNKLYEAIFDSGVPGITDVTTLEIKFSGAFGTANLPVTNHQIATLDTSNITIA